MCLRIITNGVVLQTFPAKTTEINLLFSYLFLLFCFLLCLLRQVVNLLDGKRSMQINIVLKNFNPLSAADVLHAISTLDSNVLSEERICGLQKILPEPEEAEMVRSYDGEIALLGDAERYFLNLIKVGKELG